MRTLYLALVLAAAPLAAQTPPSPTTPSDSAAPQAEASVKRAKECDAAAAGKHLSDAQYRTYLQACLASTRPPAELFESMRTIEKRCNTIANARQLTAQDRVTFMQSCRRKGG